MKSFEEVYNEMLKNKLEDLEKLRKEDLFAGKLEILTIILCFVATIMNFL